MVNPSRRLSLKLLIISRLVRLEIKISRKEIVEQGRNEAGYRYKNKNPRPFTTGDFNHSSKPIKKYLISYLLTTYLYAGIYRKVILFLIFFYRFKIVLFIYKKLFYFSFFSFDY